MEGILNVNKPKGISSYDVIRHIKRVMRVSCDDGMMRKRAPEDSSLSHHPVIASSHHHCPKVGHAGTLDPFANGVLLIMLGRKVTKRFSDFTDTKKRYKGTIFLGETTDTLDPTGRIITRSGDDEMMRKEGFASPSSSHHHCAVAFTLKQLKEKAQQFLGEIDQVPPLYCALHYKGKRLYKLARNGETPEIPPRKVNIYEFGILDYKHPRVYFEALVGKGAYLRSLARDFALSLGTIGYLEDLTREAVGRYNIGDSASLTDLNSVEDLERSLIDIAG
ncbi:tRNA pseudouridine synthase B [Elusimicrobiota bacterium]